MKKNSPGYNGSVRHYIETPGQAMAENDIAKAKAKLEADSDPWAVGLNMFGNMAMQYGTSMMNKGASQGQGVDGKGAAGFLNENNGAMNGIFDMIQGVGNSQMMATGGTIGGNAEVEGDEIIETPDGQMEEVQGPSHENGGVDMLLPPGTDIFSARLTGPDGKTMADRKKAREKKANKYQKLFDKSPSDATLKKTLNKVMKANEVEEEADLKSMETARQVFNMGATLMTGGKMKYAYGGSVPFDLSFLFPNAEDTKTPGFNPNIDYGAIDETFETMPVQDNASVYDTTGNDFQVGASPGGQDNQTGGGSQFLNSLFGDVTLGDGVGMLGNLISTFGPERNTQKNRAGDTPNINAYKDFGNDALDRLDESKGYAAGQRDSALKRLELSRRGASSRNRKSARGVNTQRALDLATDMGINQQESNVYDAFAQQMQQILGQQAGFENQQDQVVMAGEQARDLADRQDRDNYFTQMAQDIATKGTGLQKIGGDINTIKERGTTEEMLNQIYPNFEIDLMSGQISGKESAPLIKESSIYNDLPSKALKKKYYNNVIADKWTWEDGKLLDEQGVELDPTTLKPKSK